MTGFLHHNTYQHRPILVSTKGDLGDYLVPSLCCHGKETKAEKPYMNFPKATQPFSGSTRPDSNFSRFLIAARTH